MTAQHSPYLDPLYGDCDLPVEIHSLVSSPTVQRLRNIRLSNIDSLSMPGIANISRYEHALGTAFLASQLQWSSAQPKDSAVLVAAALLHDSAMPPFGHLGEEALAYLGVQSQHEQQWRQILGKLDGAPVGGIDCQVYLGRATQLTNWAQEVFRGDWRRQIKRILDSISGIGVLGKAIAGDIDLDNMDNVVRASFHMGLDVDRTLPLRLVAGVVDITIDGIVFSTDTLPLVQEWLDLRQQVYERFMLSRVDFAGKLMLLSATLNAQRLGLLNEEHWHMTEWEYLSFLVNEPHNDIREPTRRWLLAEPWALSRLHWLQGNPPTYVQMLTFSEQLSIALNRQCLAYRIPDKSTRAVRVLSDAMQSVEFGHAPSRCLLGVGSPIRREFSTRDNDMIQELAIAVFHSDCTCVTTDNCETPREPSSLLF